MREDASLFEKEEKASELLKSFSLSISYISNAVYYKVVVEAGSVYFIFLELYRSYVCLKSAQAR